MFCWHKWGQYSDPRNGIYAAHADAVGYFAVCQMRLCEKCGKAETMGKLIAAEAALAKCFEDTRERCANIVKTNWHMFATKAASESLADAVRTLESAAQDTTGDSAGSGQTNPIASPVPADLPGLEWADSIERNLHGIEAGIRLCIEGGAELNLEHLADQIKEVRAEINRLKGG